MYFVYESNLGYQLIDLKDLSIRSVSYKEFEFLVRTNPDSFVNVQSGSDEFYLDDDLDTFEEEYDDEIFITDDVLSDCEIYINVKDVFMYSNDATFKINNRIGRLGVSYRSESEFTLFRDVNSVAKLKEDDYDASIKDMKFSFVFLRGNILVLGLNVLFWNNADWYQINLMYDIKLGGFCDIKSLSAYVTCIPIDFIQSEEYIAQLMLDSEFFQLVNMG